MLGRCAKITILTTCTRWGGSRSRRGESERSHQLEEGVKLLFLIGVPVIPAPFAFFEMEDIGAPADAPETAEMVAAFGPEGFDTADMNAFFIDEALGVIDLLKLVTFLFELGIDGIHI